MLREIVLDTETTGLDAAAGDRLIEIGCIELLNRIPTGNEFHCFINPEERQVHPEAEAIHGISNAFLSDKPKFRDVAQGFLDFVSGSYLVIHNAAFDMGFINTELERIGLNRIPKEGIVDTLALARRKHPAGPNTLDGLCKRYGIDNSKRIKHGALMDATLLAEVYIELLGERQADLGLAKQESQASVHAVGHARAKPRQRPLPPRMTTADIDAHRDFVKTLGPDAVWLNYIDQDKTTI